MTISPNLKYGILAITAVVLGCGWYNEHSQRGEELREMHDKVTELKESEEKSIISSRMSDQLNSIAEEQRFVLDQQLEEVTKLQKETQSLLLTSEKDKRIAIEARILADSAAKEAEKQRALAETNRRNALKAKNAADTLSYQALASSLAATSLMKQSNGEYELAVKLAYLAYIYTKRYGSDPFTNYVFSALFSPSGMNFTTIDLLGRRMSKIVELDKDSLIALGATGDVALVTDFHFTAKDQEKQVSVRLLADVPDLDYRDVLRIKNHLLLLSYDGHLVEYISLPTKEIKIHELPLHECLAIYDYDETRFVVIGRHAICMVNKNKLTGKRVETIVFENEICTIGEWMGHKAFADSKGRILYLGAGGATLLQEIKLPALPSSLVWDKETGAGAIGCKDGSIYLQKDGKTTILKGHNSTVSGMAFNGDVLYSGSFDRKAIRWNLKSENIEPFVLYNHNFWVSSVYFQKPNLLCGLQSDGRLLFMRPDVDLLAEAVRVNISHNLSQEEWETYVGNKIPYEKIIDTEN